MSEWVNGSMSKFEDAAVCQPIDPSTHLPIHPVPRGSPARQGGEEWWATRRQSSEATVVPGPLRRAGAGRPWYGVHRVGLTLVELLVAMGILVTVSASALLMFRGVTRAWRTGELRTERYQQARLLFDLFNRELSSTVASVHYPLVGTKAAEAPRLAEGSVDDELFFVGRLPGRTGLIERGYWVNADGDLLCHDEEPADGTYATGLSELCGRDVATFEISYFDGSSWLDQWDARPEGAQAAQLPKAVHVVLSIGRKTPERFETVIYVPTS